MIHHVGREVRPADAEGEVAFWALLGFAEVEPPGSLGDRSRWVERDGRQIHLPPSDAPVVPREGHVAVHAPDYAAVGERLRAAGFDVEPRQQHWGAARAFVRPPAGHRVEVMAAPPPTAAR